MRCRLGPHFCRGTFLLRVSNATFLGAVDPPPKGRRVPLIGQLGCSVAGYSTRGLLDGAKGKNGTYPANRSHLQWPCLSFIAGQLGVHRLIGRQRCLARRWNY